MILTTNELFKSLWKSCDELRYTVAPIYYKDYILRLLFLKYMADKEQSGYFQSIASALDTVSIGATINQVCVMFEADHNLDTILSCINFDDNQKLGSQKVKVLSGLVRIFAALDFRQAQGDLITEAYEFLSHNFAVQAAKDKGQFYTPTAVSRLLSELLGIDTAGACTVYDPTCGSGSLLAQAIKVNPQVTVFGQELDYYAAMFAQMNMMLYGAQMMDIRHGDTLSKPAFADGVFDFVVANPPFSVGNWSVGIDWQNDSRFKEYTKPPEKCGDYAFILHSLASLNETGKAAIIMATGILFRSGREGEIRKQLLQTGHVAAVIGLPANLFYGTTIPTVLIVLDKSKRYDDVLFIDASHDCIERDKLNVIQERHAHKLIKTVNNRLTIKGYSSLVPLETILNKEDGNLNIIRWVDTSKPEQQNDMYAIMHGGIPNSALDELEPYWSMYSNLRNSLLETTHSRIQKQYNKEVEQWYSKFLIEQSELADAIKNHIDVMKWRLSIEQQVVEWWERLAVPLILSGDNPKVIYHRLSESILARFIDIPLIDGYALYQAFVDYWNSTLLDAIELMQAEGFPTALAIQESADGDLSIGKVKYKSRLVSSKTLYEYFGARSLIDEAWDKAGQATSELESALEDSTELLQDACIERGDELVLTKASITSYLKTIKGKMEYNDEINACTYLLGLFDAEATANKGKKQAEDRVTQLFIDKLSQLTQADQEVLVIDLELKQGLFDQFKRAINQPISQLIQELKAIHDKYGKSLIEIEKNIVTLRGKLDRYLEELGYTL